jgi:hypothetical protein
MNVEMNAEVNVEMNAEMNVEMNFEMNAEVNPEVNDTNEDIKLNRDPRLLFHDGQLITHKIPDHSIWIGVYNKIQNRFVCINNGVSYRSLNQFTVNHYRNDRPDRKSDNNAWLECECDINGAWVSTYQLPLYTERTKL